jgi:hypothetical protein
MTVTVTVALPFAFAAGAYVKAPVTRSIEGCVLNRALLLFVTLIESD